MYNYYCMLYLTEKENVDSLFEDGYGASIVEDLVYKLLLKSQWM